MPTVPAQRPEIHEVVELMRRRRVTMVDLIEVDHRTSPPDKVLAVTRCWELLARLGLRFADPEAAGLRLEDKVPERLIPAESKTSMKSKTCRGRTDARPQE
jgi:hypothetical protein